MTALRRRASEVIDAELLRLDARLPALDPAVREEFGQTVHRVVDKLLHTPTVQVKRLAEGPDGSSTRTPCASCSTWTRRRPPRSPCSVTATCSRHWRRRCRPSARCRIPATPRFAAPASPPEERR